MFVPTINKEDLEQMELERFDGCIHVIDTSQAAIEAIRTLRKNSRIGFDTETKPSFVRGERTEVALLQLSTQTDCFLFRLNIMGLIDELRDLLMDPAILKVGLSIHDDYISLRRRSPFEHGGFVELQRMCPAYGIKDASLLKIYSIIFHKRISKAQRLSNWEASKLSERQQMYAALDAWACLRIFDHLMTLPAPSPIQFALL